MDVKEKLPQILCQTIIDDRIDVLTAGLQLLPLDKIDINLSDKLLGVFLDLAVDYSRNQAVKIIYEAFENSKPDADRISLIAYMITNHLFTDKVIIFVLRELKFTFMDLFEQIITQGDTSETSLAVFRLINFFGIESLDNAYEILTSCLEKVQFMSIETPMIQLEETLTEMVINKAPLAKVPPYMLEYQESEGLDTPEVTFPDLMNLSDEEIVKQLIGDIDDLDINLTMDAQEQNLTVSQVEVSSVSEGSGDTRKNILLESLKTSTPEERQKIIEPIRIENEHKILSANENLFKMYGPSHPTYGNPLDDSPCGRHGGCRMLLCICHETTVIETDDLLSGQLDIEDIDWFEGHCDECAYNISKKCYAVRKPIFDGGWKGTFCSFECIRQNVLKERPPAEAISSEGNMKKDESSSEDDDGIVKEGDIRPDIMPFIDLFEDLIKNIGIYDREL